MFVNIPDSADPGHYAIQAAAKNRKSPVVFVPLSSLESFEPL